jgi:hypothetical protein
MPGPAGTIETIARQLGLALQPLEQKLAPGNIIQLFAELGLQFPPQLLKPDFVNALNAGATAAGKLPGIITQLSAHIEGDNEAGILQDGIQLTQQIATVIAALEQVGTALGNTSGSLPGMNAVEVTAFAQKLPSRLLSDSLISYLETIQPAVVGIGNLLGILDYIPNPGVPGDPTHPAYNTRQLQLSRLGDVLASPVNLFRTLYGWGNPGFDATILVPRLNTSLNLLGAPSQVVGSGPSNSLDSSLVSVRSNPASNPLGLLATLKYPIPSGIDLTLPLSAMWSVRIQVQGAFDAGLQATITPPLNFSLKPPAGTLTGLLGMELVAKGPDSSHPIILIGQTGGSRLQSDSLTFGAGLAVKWDPDSKVATGEPLVRFDVRGGKAVIDTSNGDGFIAKILGGFKLDIDFGVGLDYSISDGLRFRGGGALEIQLASHVTLGPVAVNNLTLAFGIKDGAFPIAISADLQTSLGPLTAIVNGLGFQVAVKLASDNKGNLGPVDIRPSFLPPKGVGLELVAGGFDGGGFLRLDPDKGEYEGGLELTFLGTISVRAVGVLSTRMPDGGEGFSLLIILVSEFPPLQLSYGFTLLGIGGLLGLNRTVLLDALQVGVRDGSLNSILFPADVVANATRIIGDLKRVFPPQDGHFLVGPMAKLGWGTPTLISLSLGLILDLPRPTFAVIGVLRMALPAEDVAILHLQVSFAGSVDFERGQLQFDASLFDSRVLTFTLTGDMAVRVYWKDNANFLLTVGGFHPAYTPPPMNLGELARLGMVLFQGNPHVSAQVYFAVTSNTVQFGARVEAYYGIALFNVYGFLGLDVLINFNPFHFVAEIEAGLGVRTGSTVLFAIQLQLLLEGPTPWHARGTGSFRIGFIIKVRINAGFNVTFGDDRATLLPPVDVLAEVVKALGNLGNWRPRLPSGSNQHVILRELPDPTKTLVLHPFGALEITQKLVPLHVAIQRFGPRAPVAGSVFTLADVKLGAEDAVVVNTREQFAPAQFFNLSDAEKLSRPSFADYDAGIVIGGDLAPHTDFMRTRDVVYEPIYLPEHHPVLLIFKLVVDLARWIVRGSAVAQSSVSFAQSSPSALAERASLTPERYAVVSTTDLTLHGSHLVFDNTTAADQAVQRLVGERPELFGAIQVLPATAAVTASTRPS